MTSSTNQTTFLQPVLNGRHQCTDCPINGLVVSPLTYQCCNGAVRKTDAQQVQLKLDLLQSMMESVQDYLNYHFILCRVGLSYCGYPPHPPCCGWSHPWCSLVIMVSAQTQAAYICTKQIYRLTAQISSCPISFRPVFKGRQTRFAVWAQFHYMD